MPFQTVEVPCFGQQEPRGHVTGLCQNVLTTRQRIARLAYVNRQGTPPI